MAESDEERQRRIWQQAFAGGPPKVVKPDTPKPATHAGNLTRHANGGMVGSDYAKTLPERGAMRSLDRSQRTINDYAKRTPMKLR